VLPEQLLVDPWLVVHPLRIGNGNQFQQVAVSLHVFGQQDQVIPRPVLLLILVLELNTPGGNIGFHPKDGFNAVLFAGFVKILDPEHVAMIRQGQCTHSVVFCLADQSANAGSAIQDRILTVNMQMCKRDHGPKELT